MQRTQQFVQRDLLLRRAVILVLPVERWLVIAMSSFVAHSDAIGIMSSHMAAFELLGSTVIERTISAHVEVITRVLAEATGPVACSKFL